MQTESDVLYVSSGICRNKRSSSTCKITLTHAHRTRYADHLFAGNCALVPSIPRHATSGIPKVKGHWKDSVKILSFIVNRNKPFSSSLLLSNNSRNSPDFGTPAELRPCSNEPARLVSSLNQLKMLKILKLVSLISVLISFPHILLGLSEGTFL